MKPNNLPNKIICKKCSDYGGICPMTGGSCPRFLYNDRLAGFCVAIASILIVIVICSVLWIQGN